MKKYFISLSNLALFGVLSCTEPVAMKDAFQHEQLWESFKEGDKDAFGEIYRKHVIVLLNYGSKICNNSAIVEDCIQDLFIDLWERRNGISSTTSIKFYLFKALRHRIYRYNNKCIAEMESLGEHTIIINNPSFEEHIIQMEVESFQMKHIRQKVDELPVRQREAINLRYYHNFSNEEIASLMGINYHTACKFIYAGLKKLVQNVSRGVGMLLLWLSASL